MLIRYYVPSLRRYVLKVFVGLIFLLYADRAALADDIESLLNDVRKSTSFPGAFSAEWRVDRTLEADSKLAEDGYKLAIIGLEKKVKDAEALEIEKKKWKDFYYNKYSKQSKNVIDVSVLAKSWNTLHAIVSWDAGKATHDYFITDGLGYRFVRNSRIQVPIDNVDNQFSAILVGVPSSLVHSLLTSVDLKSVSFNAKALNGITSLQFDSKASQVNVEVNTSNQIISVVKVVGRHKLFRIQYVYGGKSSSVAFAAFPSAAAVEFFNPDESLYYSETWNLKNLEWIDPKEIKTVAPLLPGKDLEIDEHETISSDEIIKRLKQ